MHLYSAYWRMVYASYDLGVAVLDFWKPPWWEIWKKKENNEIVSRMMGGSEIVDLPDPNKKKFQ